MASKVYFYIFPTLFPLLLLGSYFIKLIPKKYILLCFLVVLFILSRPIYYNLNNILNLKKKKSYDEEQQLIIRHSSKEQEILNLDLVINTKVDAKSRILENNKDTIIKSSLTEQEQTNLNDRYINLFNELNNKKE